MWEKVIDYVTGEEGVQVGDESYWVDKWKGKRTNPRTSRKGCLTW